MEAPIEFITADEDDHLEVNPKAIELLRQVNKCLIPVAIVGTYRTGKSYLLNRLMGRNDGFPLGSTVQSKTKGIWMWLRDHPTDESKALLLLDTEGLNDAEKGSKGHDANIFTLAVLLCSVLVYNSKGAIDSSALDGLHLATELTEHIRVKSTKSAETPDLENDESGNEFSLFFPSLIWAVRDHHLTLEIEEKTCTPTEYLEFCLRLKQGRGMKTAKYNELRSTIRDYFTKRSCFVFPPPLADLAQLEHLDSMAENELDPRFVRAGSEFCQFVYDNSHAKAVHGKDICGSTFASLAETYVQAVLSGNICIDNAFQAVMNKENEAALQEAVAVFQKPMEVLKYPLELEDYDKNYQQANNAATDVFLSKAINIDKYPSFNEKLRQTVDKLNDKFLERNIQESVNLSRQTLESLWSNSVQKKLDEQEYMCKGGYDKFSKDVNAMVQQYQTSPMTMGPAKMGELQAFTKTTIDVLKKQILHADKSLAKAAKKHEEEKLKAEEAERERIATEDRLEKLREHQEKVKEGYEENMRKYQEECQKQQEAEMQKMKDDLEEKKSERERLLQEGMKEQANMMKEIMNGQMKMMADKEEARLKFDRETRAMHMETMKQMTENQNRMMEQMANQPKPKGGCSIS